LGPAMPAVPREQSTSAPDFGVCAVFMLTPFNAERPNSTGEVTHMLRGLFLGSHPPLHLKAVYL